MIAHARAAPPHIPPTLQASAAAAVRWHAVVVGAGPAGAAAALRLARRGLRVLLVDAASMPRPKVCGCCLSTTAVAELRGLGIIAAAEPAALLPHHLLPLDWIPLARVTLAARGSVATIAMPGGGVISRDSLDSRLVAEAIAAGAAWLPETRVVSIDEAEGTVVVACSGPGREGSGPGREGSGSGREESLIRAELAVIAGGLAPAIEVAAHDRRCVAADSRVGLGAILPETAPGPEPGRLLMAVSRQGYCGIVRLEDGRMDVAAAVDAKAVGAAGGAAPLLSAILADACGRAEADRWAPALAGATFRGTPRLTHASPPVATASGRVVRIGDAAAYVEPFTGEGMGWALTTSRLLADAIESPAAAGPIDAKKAAIRYAASHSLHCARHHARCLRITRVVRRPTFVACAAGLARFAPAAAARVVPLVVGASPDLEHTS